MGSVHPGPVNHHGNEAEIAHADMGRAFRRMVEAELGSKTSFAQYEVQAMATASRAVQELTEEVLQEMSDGYNDELRLDGVVYRRSHGMARGTYHSLCGRLEVQRATYRRVGERNSPTVVPLELEAGLVEHATPALGYSIALNLSKETSRDYVESMGGAHRQVPSRSTVERIGQAIGSKAREIAPKVERFLRMSEGVPPAAQGLSLGLDRTTVPFEEKRDPNGPAPVERKKRTQPYIRKAPEPVDVKFRMAYVGTVGFTDENGEFLATRKYAATHHEGPDAIMARMVADVRAAKLRQPTLELGVVQDGAPEMWRLTRDALEQESSVDTYYEAIDRYHLNARLGTGLPILEPEPEQRASRMKSWKEDLDADDTAIERIERDIDEQVPLYTGKQRDTLWENLVFIDNNKDRMRYAGLRKAGLPVGSGVTEAACKSVVGFRTKRSGQRWHDEGVTAIVTLRAIHQSDRLPGFWRHLARHYTATVEAAA